MFNHYKPFQVAIDHTLIHGVVGGQGPPVLLLHGYPQTHFIWHKIADQLAAHFTVIATDLRGYGDSSKPPTDVDHKPYSKRSSALDQVGVMKHFGFDQFYVVGHDRGGRVGHRMALDHPSTVKKLVVMDIAPTYIMYQSADREFATAYYHWFFLIQPFDLPEQLIGNNPTYYLDQKFGQWGRDPSAFTDEAFAEYARCFTPETIHASCEDYRASASIDMEHDKLDLANGRIIQCPLCCLWGGMGFVGKKYDVLLEWSTWADHVEGAALPCGHYLAEEAPDDTLEALLKFLK